MAGIFDLFRGRPRRGIVVTDPSGNLKTIPFSGDATEFLNGAGAMSSPSSGSSGIDQLTGDVTAGPGTGSQAATIGNDKVTNAKAANMAQSTIKGRAAAAGTGDPTDLTPNEVSTLLDGATDPFVRTSAAGGGLGSLEDYGQVFRPGVYNVLSSAQVGDATVGVRFIPNANFNVTGAEFFITGVAIGKNVKVRLWSDAGTSLASVTVNSVVSGSNIATFGSPVAVVAGTAYRLSMWITDGSRYMNDAEMPAFVVTTAAVYTHTRYWLAGDNFPTSLAAGERYPINPTLA